MTRGKEMKVSIFLKSGEEKEKGEVSEGLRRVELEGRDERKTHFLRILRSQILDR